jgi:hypothetical protein
MGTPGEHIELPLRSQSLFDFHSAEMVAYRYASYRTLREMKGAYEKQSTFAAKHFLGALPHSLAELWMAAPWARGPHLPYTSLGIAS